MSNLNIPKVIFGTSGLGNLYTALTDDVKRAIVAQSLQHSPKPAVFDSAGKYGAGLALEALGKCLKELGVTAADVLISNKLGWLRTELKTPEPTFEPGVWKDLQFDAVQAISYDGILQCYAQGNELLNGYDAQLVSVHDPDEYLAAAKDADDRAGRYQDILAAYRALAGLKQQGKVKAIGVGAKDWQIIKQITNDVDLDWVMIANSMTIHSHPANLLVFMQQLRDKGVAIINSAVFNAGFLTGGNYYNYRELNPNNTADQALIKWRRDFFELCAQYNVKPAAACVQFGLNAPGVQAIALNTTNPNRVQENVAVADVQLPDVFVDALHTAGLINNDGLAILLHQQYL